MPLDDYGVLKGRATGREIEVEGDSPHYQILIETAGTRHAVAVNVKSKLAPSELLYLVADDFRHPITAGLTNLPRGFTALAREPGGLALDFIRGNLFDRLEMRPLPFNIPGQDNDLNERLDLVVQRAIHDAEAEVYAFGEPFGPNPGIHDVHMNQGNAPQFVEDDGVWQDGGLMFRFPAEGRWVAIFLAFQSQAWHTDDITGHTIPIEDGHGPANQPTPAEPDFVVRIVAAMVNPSGPAPEAETVTLLNASPQPIDLTGWAIADRLKRRHRLNGVLAAGAARAFAVAAPAQFGNDGGIVTLLNADGLKVDGVAYTAGQARREGWTIVF